MNDERSAMGKYYLFGAGINGVAAIKFFKRKNIIAVIDNDGVCHCGPLLQRIIFSELLHMGPV